MFVQENGRKELKKGKDRKQPMKRLKSERKSKISMTK
jgi:hypothetical protein